MSIKNIILDFGGVLFDIDYHAPHREFAKLGWEHFNEDYSQASQNEIYDLLETGKIEVAEFWSYLASRMPMATQTQIAAAWNSILLYPISSRITQLPILKKYYRTFLLSNTNAIHAPVFEEMMKQTGEWTIMENALEAIHYSQDLGKRKPHPETFLHVCQLHALDPSETLFVDDSIQHVKGAREAGLIGLHLTPGMDLFELLASVGVKTTL
jgi:FMN phosphatase YigB (HAD superfamily)